jgi:predicted PurR-regulated permease PerM
MDPRPADPLENRAFALFVVVVTGVLAWTLAAFSGSILWAVVLAVVFTPLADRFRRRWPDRPGRAAALTLAIVVAGLVVPLLLIGGVIVGEITRVVHRVRSGELDPGALFGRLTAALPDWAQGILQRSGLTDMDAVAHRLSDALQAQLRGLAARALTIGGDVIGGLLGLAIMLFLLFVLLRDGRSLAARAGEAVPLRPAQRALIAERFVAVVRATVKGSVVMAAIQGALGGVVMALLGVPEALLWGVVMAFSALLPAIGSGLVWLPAALYLFAAGETWRGIAMALAGALLIGNVDNVLRPVLVGRDTKLPGPLVLITTLGGLSAFGFSGLVIGPIAAALFLAAWAEVRQERLAAAGIDAPPPS